MSRLDSEDLEELWKICRREPAGDDLVAFHL